MRNGLCTEPAVLQGRYRDNLTSAEWESAKRILQKLIQVLRGRHRSVHRYFWDNQ